MIVLWRGKSLNGTGSLIGGGRGPPQRAAIGQTGPRTVAAAYLPLVRNLPCALECRSCRVLLETAAPTALPFLALQLAQLGAPLNALDTSEIVARPERVWVTLNTAPPNLPVWVLTLDFFFFLAS